VASPLAPQGQKCWRLCLLQLRQGFPALVLHLLLHSLRVWNWGWGWGLASSYRRWNCCLAQTGEPTSMHWQQQLPLLEPCCLPLDSDLPASHQAVLGPGKAPLVPVVAALGSALVGPALVLAMVALQLALPRLQLLQGPLRGWWDPLVVAQRVEPWLYCWQCLRLVSCRSECISCRLLCLPVAEPCRLAWSMTRGWPCGTASLLGGSRRGLRCRAGSCGVNKAAAAEQQSSSKHSQAHLLQAVTRDCSTLPLQTTWLQPAAT
jgi:hypothetical protein